MEIQPKQPSAKGSPKIFTGDVWIDPIAKGDEPSRIKVSFVHFSPGARNAWHAHALGQTIHVTEGIGRMQARGGEVLEIHPGDTVVTPPGEWHWHGAAPDHFMTHLAMWETPAEATETEWGAQVAEAEYRGRPRRPAESQERGSDLSVLRELADEGNEDAERRLTELAAQAGDLDELRRLADEGNEDAERRLTELAAQRGDLDELRRLADEGNEDAEARLAELAAQRGDLDELRRLADEGNEDAEARLAELIREMK